MDVGAARRARRLLGQRVGAVEGAVHNHLLDPLATDRRDAAALLAGRVRRQVNGSAHAQVSACVGEALGVVTG